MFDSMEAGSHRTSGCSTTSALAEAFLRAEILDVVCGEGSARAECHEPERSGQIRQGGGRI